MNIKRIVADIKKESWYTKLDAVNRLGNIIYENPDDAEYVLNNLIIELESPKTVMQARILWAVNNIIKQYPQLTYKVIPHLLRLSECENKAINEIVSELLNKPVIKYAISRYSTLLSKYLHSEDQYLKLEAMMNIWKMAPVDPELIDSLLPEMIESILEKNNLKVGIYSWLILESEDNTTIDEIADLLNKVYLHIDPNTQYPATHIKKLISSPDVVSKLVGVVLIEKNPEILNNELIEDLLKVFTTPNLNRYLKTRLFLTMGLFSKDKPYLKNLIINEANKIINNEKDWLLMFGALVGFYVIGEKITNTKLLHHENSVIRAISVQLVDSRSAEKCLELLNDQHITTFVSTIDRLIKKDIDNEMKLKFLNELSNPWNYPYINKNINEESVVRIRDDLGNMVNSWDQEHWVSKINLMNDLGNLAVDNPDYVDSSIDLIVKSIEDKFGMVRAQGLWIVRAILNSSKNDPFHILEKLDSYLDPKLKTNDPNVFVRLNFVLLLRKFAEILKGIEGSEERISEITGFLISVSLNDEIKIVSEIAKLILKYDFEIELNESEITIENFKDFVKQMPYASTGIHKFLVRKYKNDPNSIKIILSSCGEYIEYGCDVLCIINGIPIENDEVFSIAYDLIAKTSDECFSSVQAIINTYLLENSWKMRLKGISAIEQISELDVGIIDFFIATLIETALFDKIFELRVGASALINKLNYGVPEIDWDTSMNYFFKSNNELMDIIKTNQPGLDEALYVLSIRKTEIQDIESLIMVVSKVRNDELWFRRAYAYNILENILELPKVANYHYEIINWCLESLEDPNPISKVSKRILEKLGRTTTPTSSRKTISDRIRRIESLLESGDWSVKVEALQSLQDFINEGHYGYLDMVMDKLDDPHWKVKNCALGILADIDPDLIKPAIPKIIRLLKDGDESVILKTLLTLKKFGQKDHRVLEKIMPMLDELENYGTWSIKEEIMRLKLSYYNKARQKH